MNNMKKGQIAAILSALMLAGTLTACGQDSVGSTAENSAESSVSAAESSKDESTESEQESAAEESSSADSKTESKSSGKSGSKTDSKTESKSDSKSDSKASGNSESKADSQSSSKADSQTESKSDSKTTSKASDSSSSQSSGTSASGGKTDTGSSSSGSAAPTPAPADDDTDNAEEPTKYIYLKDTTAQYSGDGIAVNGSVITISKGGTYEISGALENGQIVVNTDKKKVKLHLNNVSITNKAGSAINCQNAKKLTISTLAGTVNYLEDGGTHDEDKGTIFSEDTVNLKGEGELNITANYAHGVQSDDDIIINGGTINITSAKSCLHSNDGIEINAGNLFCDGGTNGIKTDGYITFTGGRAIFLGGTREEKGAIYCDGVFTVSGGQFFAIGNTCTAPDEMTTSVNVIGMTFANTQAAGTLVNVQSGGNSIFTMTSPRNFRYVVYAGDNLASGAEYQVDYGGSCDGTAEHSVYSGAYTSGTDGGTFTADKTVTFYTVG